MQSLWESAESSARIVRLTETVEIRVMVRLFEDVATEQGWQPGEALQLWIPHSVYFAVQTAELRQWRESGELAGGLQLVTSDSQGTLPCSALWPEVVSGSPHRTAHVAMLAIDAEFRGQTGLFWQLAIEMWRYCVEQGITTLFLEVTPRVLPLYRRLGWPLQIRGDKRIHWGEECYLCTLGIPEVAQTLLERAEHSQYYRQIVAQAFRVTLAVSEASRDTSEPERMYAAAA